MARSKLVMTVLGAAAVLAVAGCGSVTAADAGSASHASAATGGAAASPSGGGSTAPSPGQVNGTGGPIGAFAGLLCAAPAAVNRVLITRTGMAGPMLPSGPRISAFVTSANPPTPGLLVHGAGPARALAKAVCGLPAMTGTVLHCPQLGLPGFRLTFTVGSRILPAVLVQPSGCLTVTGAGPVRTASRNSAFLKLLTSMVGPLPLPGAVHLPGTAVS
ncbi:MAG TPA: hypothetical protein VIZ00_08430 [Streptosporangiaceae bacterium]